MKRLQEAILAIILVLFMVLVIVLIIVFLPGKEKELKQYLENNFERDASAMCTKLKKAEWDHLTDLRNKIKYKAYVDTMLEADIFIKKTWEDRFKNLDPSNFKDEAVRRQARRLKVLGDSALEESKLANLSAIKIQMVNVYATARICPFTKQKCNLEKEGLNKDKTEQLFANSNDYNELLYVWKSWRDATGFKIKQLYKAYVELSNEAARLNGFKDKGDQWRNAYELTLFSRKLDNLWKRIEPFYIELHKYIIRKLKDHFEDKLDVADGLIPSHVFRTMWSQSWHKLIEIVKPFPSASRIQIDWKSESYTVMKMFETANKFYKSMGLYSADMSYSVAKGAMIEKPADREVDCNPTAVDFCDGKNYRLRMCAKVSMIDFINIYHEMGHIQYFLQYAKQPFTFRFGANPGFHEAVGDTMAMICQSPKYLTKIKLLKDYTYTYESSINLLMSNALKIVTFLPFGLILDKWRWEVFSGEIKPIQWNTRWWEYRKKYQRVKPPIVRSERDFDPAAIFHFASDATYISYFVSEILQFQFYRSLCISAGEYDPKTKNFSNLNHCDFSDSVAAGKKFSEGLKLGASKHWKDVLRVMTGQSDLDATPLLEYFEPLHDFLIKENNR